MKRGMTRRELEIKDVNEIKAILDKSIIVHVAMVDNGEPYMVPMNYGYTFEEGKLSLYLHGAAAGRKLDVMRANPNVFFEIECDVTPFSGEMACQHGTAYSSIMGKGKAVILEGEEAKKQGLSIFMKSQTKKDFVFDDRMVSIVSVIRVDVSEYTAKCRKVPVNAKVEK